MMFYTAQFGKNDNWEQCFLAAHALRRYIIRYVGLWCNTLTCLVKGSPPGPTPS